MGIQPLVAHSPLVGRMYNFLSVRSFSAMLGCVEIGTAALISLQYLSSKASAVGAILAIGLFATTLSMLFTTPGWEPTLGFPGPIRTARTVPAQRHRTAGSLGLVARGIAQGRCCLTTIKPSCGSNLMNYLIKVCQRYGILDSNIDYHVLRASMVLIFLYFGYQKWFEYEAQALIPYISNGPLLFWMYPVFGVRGACWFLGGISRPVEAASSISAR
jgi:uncharacterized membrane protein YkgB